MSIFFVASNILLSILVFMGILSFSDSIIWSLIGALLITGSASANPFYALFAYPVVELLFSDYGLSGYSMLIVLITLAQFFVVYKAANKIS